ncbi:MAG TPA: dihydrolipoyllysine-residue acetyltransferase [Thiobacillaceae bacterium]|nr:dihydrolipoyllysine-residue acetyltransferase [Thiobacillaceae bacterium]HNU63492.1 dihydrolipoyllysine-residue acetyltransferase [Thiobacillaceae bacterium]
MSIKEVVVPDIGNFENVEIIEVMVKPGDSLASDDPIMTVESDKAAMDIPAPFAGTVKELRIKVGDKVSAGSPMLLLDTAAEEKPGPAVAAPVVKSFVPPAAEAAAAVPPPTHPVPEAPATIPPRHRPDPVASHVEFAPGKPAHASPAVRRFARELGIEGEGLNHIRGSGPRGRITREDVQAWVKGELAKPRGEGLGGATGLAVPPAPVIDFSQFGEIDTQPLSRIRKLSGANLHRNWVTAPHVTQFDEADITDLEDFRKSMLEEAAKRGVKLTLLAFLMKAVVNALRAFPQFNASLAAEGENLVLKKYFHVGFACDTPDGLVVPVIRDVNKKDVLDIARELADLSELARERKLKVDAMQGGCFTISSLGGIGGTAFTPIINCPEVAILGVSRAEFKPVWDKAGKVFEPRLMLPLSLSYDHRVIDGADGARFTSHLRAMLSDVRRLLL